MLTLVAYWFYLYRYCFGFVWVGFGFACDLRDFVVLGILFTLIGSVGLCFGVFCLIYLFLIALDFVDVLCGFLFGTVSYHGAFS